MTKENSVTDETAPPFEDGKRFSEQEAESVKRYQEAIQHSKIFQDICQSIQLADKRFEGVIERVKVTFWSILIMNWILIGMGVAMFGGAFYSALGGRFDITAVLTATGFGNILAVFVFSMNRVQTSLGDQVQVQIAYNGFMKQITEFDEHFKFDAGVIQIREINEEMRKITLTSMELIQRFTKIGSQSSAEPWMNPFPIKYGKLEVPNEVFIGDPITIRGTLTNTGVKPITVTSIVIAVRHPLGTPTGGPFTYDFAVQPGRTIDPNQSVTITNTKTIEANWDPQKKNPEITDDLIDKDWYAYTTCQTEDGYWHDDPNKNTFRVKKKATQI